MLQTAAAARRENRPIKVSGVVKGGQLDLEYFEGICTDTPWHKTEIRITLMLPIMNGIRLPTAKCSGSQNFEDAVEQFVDKPELYDAKDKPHVQPHRHTNFLNTKAPVHSLSRYHHRQTQRRRFPGCASTTNPPFAFLIS